MAARSKKGFWDTYKDEGGGKYLTAPEKNALIESGQVLQITGVRYDEKNQYQGASAPRYVVTFIVDGTERFAGFAINEEDESSRDRLLGALAEHLDTPAGAKETILVKMEKIGNFVALVKA